MPRTFVLVHGACHGGWCWRRVADRLQRTGHRVFTPTLSGLGERSHLLSRDINLDTHIADIVNVFRWEHLRDTCLVVHSYAGWPGSGALEQITDRVSSIIWLDAHLPQDGQCGMDTANPRNRADMMTAIEQGHAAYPAPKAVHFGVNAEDRDWVDSLLTPQPIGVALQPIRLTGARERVGRKLYIRAPSFAQPSFDAAYARCKADPSWHTLTTDAGHDVMIDAPDWLAEILLKHS